MKFLLLLALFLVAANMAMAEDEDLTDTFSAKELTKRDCIATCQYQGDVAKRFHVTSDACQIVVSESGEWGCCSTDLRLRSAAVKVQAQAQNAP
ncbi:hypothetical protein BaRGS_00037242, partial [Batillaria attramentaria]